MQQNASCYHGCDNPESPKAAQAEQFRDRAHFGQQRCIFQSVVWKIYSSLMVRMGQYIADQAYLEVATAALILNALDEAALNGAMSLMNSVDGDSAATSRS